VQDPGDVERLYECLRDVQERRNLALRDFFDEIAIRKELVERQQSLLRTEPQARQRTQKAIEDSHATLARAPPTERGKRNNPAE
jgi:hypothetical protein